MPPKLKSPLDDNAPIFVNREGPIERFEQELLNIPADKPALFVVYGQGGQGKTHLCRELYRRTNEKVNPDFDFLKRAHVDLHDRLKTDPDKALIWIRNAFATPDLTFPTFDLAFLYYWEMVRKEEAAPGLKNSMLHNARGAVGDAGTDIGTFLGDLWSDTIDTIPGVKTLYKWLSQKGLDKAKEGWLKASRPETLKALFNDYGQPHEAHIIRKHLPWFLAEDLNHYRRQNPQMRFVLFIDEYERIAAEGGASTALQDHPFDAVFKEVIARTPGLLAAFFTREKLPWQNHYDWKEDLKGRQIPLEGLKDHDAEEWLLKAEVDDADIRAAMIDGARESNAPKALVYPLLLDLQVEHFRARHANGQEITAEHFTIDAPDFKGRCQTLLERVLRDYGEPMQATLKRLCVAERFDRLAFAHVIDDFKTGLALERFERIKTLSFITEDEDGFLLIHRAIRDVMLTWLEDDYKAEAIASLLGHYEERARFDPLEKAPDIELIALGQALDLRMLQDLEGVTVWLFNIAKPFEHRAKYSEIESLWRRLLNELMFRATEFELEISACNNNIASHLNAQGRYAEAEPLYKKALEIKERVLGQDHPDTATNYNNVASNLNAEGQYAEAESLFKKALEIRERVLGPDHPDTATSYNNVAFNLDDQGRYTEAEPLYKKALEIFERVLGPDHPDTATSYNNLAFNLNAQGRYAEAELLYRKALDIRERVLGQDHPDTATSYNNVASNLDDQGRFDETDPLYEKALETLVKTLGKDHPRTKIARENYLANKAKLK